MRIENSLKQITARCCVKCEPNWEGTGTGEYSSLCTRTCAMREHLDDRQWTASGVRCLTAASTSAPDCCVCCDCISINCLLNQYSYRRTALLTSAVLTSYYCVGRLCCALCAPRRSTLPSGESQEILLPNSRSVFEFS